MSGDTTRTGQQFSASTPHKLKGFRYLMGYHAGVCSLILRKFNQPYIYIDLNCGAGYQPEYSKFGDELYGSPIIAVQELNKKDIVPNCYFFDSSREALDILENSIGELQLKCEANYLCGDNKELLEEISGNLSSGTFQGLMYSDPNGKQDFPLEQIKHVLQLPQMRKVDLLMNIATTYVRRWEANPKVGWQIYSLEDLLIGHGKKYTFVRQPDNPSLKWTLMYATNWVKQKDLKNIQLFNVRGDTGKSILDHLFAPKSNPLPSIEKDGSVAIQTSLPLDFKSSNTEDTE